MNNRSRIQKEAIYNQDNNNFIRKERRENEGWKRKGERRRKGMRKEGNKG